MDFKRKDSQMTLPCKHVYHSGCIKRWLGINKVVMLFWVILEIWKFHIWCLKCMLWLSLILAPLQACPICYVEVFGEGSKCWSCIQFMKELVCLKILVLIFFLSTLIFLDCKVRMMGCHELYHHRLKTDWTWQKIRKNIGDLAG